MPVIPNSGCTADHAAIVMALKGKCRLVRESGKITLSFHAHSIPEGVTFHSFITGAEAAGVNVAHDHNVVHFRSNNIENIRRAIACLSS